MDQINILVTDDEREIADLLEIYLVSDGYRVWKAYSAKEGLQILQEHDIQSANSREYWRIIRLLQYL